MMIALSLGCASPFSGATLQLPCVIATGRGKPQIQPFPQCPESDSWPSKWRRRDGPKAGISKFSLKIPKVDGRLKPRTPIFLEEGARTTT
jgi:hypothetical protein